MGQVASVSENDQSTDSSKKRLDRFLPVAQSVDELGVNDKKFGNDSSSSSNKIIPFDELLTGEGQAHAFCNNISTRGYAVISLPENMKKFAKSHFISFSIFFSC